MSQLDIVRKQIRNLPYADMLQLTEELCTALGSKPLTKHKIADALVATSNVKIAVSEETVVEEECFERIFKQKRAIEIQLQRPRGWKLDFKSLPGSTAFGTELRPLWNQSLDQIVTLHMLGK